jgi:hypothetical protein
MSETEQFLCILEAKRAKRNERRKKKQSIFHERQTEKSQLNKTPKKQNDVKIK